MRKYLGLTTGLLAMASMGLSETFNTSYQGMGSPALRRKSQLTASQKRERLRSKRARKARRINRK